MKNPPTTITQDLKKVWIEFDQEWDDDIPMAMAANATIESPNGDTFEVDYDGLVDLLGIQEVERLESVHAESMNYTEHMMGMAEYYYEGDR